jgi:hypothetical protein
LDRIGGLRKERKASTSDQEDEQNREKRERAYPVYVAYLSTIGRKIKLTDTNDNVGLFKRIYTRNTRRKAGKTISDGINY